MIHNCAAVLAVSGCDCGLWGKLKVGQVTEGCSLQGGPPFEMQIRFQSMPYSIGIIHSNATVLASVRL